MAKDRGSRSNNLAHKQRSFCSALARLYPIRIVPCSPSQTQTPSYVPYHSVPSGHCPPKFLSSITAKGASRSTEEILQDEIGSRYSAQFVIGHDFDVY
jgi:hypothetical protein